MLSVVALSGLIILLAPVTACSSSDAVYPANPSVNSESIFVSGRGVERYDLVSGRRVWSVLQQELLHEPLVTGGRVLAGGNGGLFALDSKSGRTLWQNSFSAEIFSPVFVEMF